MHPSTCGRFESLQSGDGQGAVEERSEEVEIARPIEAAIECPISTRAVVERQHCLEGIRRSQTQRDACPIGGS